MKLPSWPRLDDNVSITATQKNNPLPLVTLENLFNVLLPFYRCQCLCSRIDIPCFTHDPSIASSLKFLRRTPWARERVEMLYLDMLRVAGRI